MKKRDLVITIGFLVVIFSVSISSIVQYFLPEGVDETSQNAIAIQEANGTTQDGNKGIVEVTTDTETTTSKWSFVYDDEDTFFNNTLNLINYYSENLALKDTFIKLNTNVSYALSLGTYYESTQVLLGKDNYLFYKTTQNNEDPIADYQGENYYSDFELNLFAGNLTSIRDYLADKGIDCYFIAIPNKEIICSDYMPDTVVRFKNYNKCDQLEDYLKENTDINFIYPDDVLKELSKDNQLFYKTDTHLNQRGSFVCFQEIMEEITGMKESIEDVTFTTKDDLIAGDLANLIGKTDKYAIDEVVVLDRTTTNPDMWQDKTVLVIGDSFSGFLSTIAKGYFANVEWIYTTDFTLSMLDEYDADVVIWETAMRRMDVFRDTHLLNQ